MLISYFFEILYCFYPFVVYFAIENYKKKRFGGQPSGRIKVPLMNPEELFEKLSSFTEILIVKDLFPSKKLVI